MTAFDDADDAADQRTRLLMIEAEIPSADDATLVALDREVATLTLLPAIERDWMAEQIEVEVRRRSS